jgi:hypothetical protein
MASSEDKNFRVTDHKERIGYLVNMHASELIQEEDKKLVACVDYYFIQVGVPPRPWSTYFILLTWSE